jgi:hypothetical protein
MPPKKKPTKKTKSKPDPILHQESYDFRGTEWTLRRGSKKHERWEQFKKLQGGRKGITFEEMVDFAMKNWEIPKSYKGQTRRYVRTHFRTKAYSGWLDTGKVKKLITLEEQADIRRARERHWTEDL